LIELNIYISQATLALFTGEAIHTDNVLFYAGSLQSQTGRVPTTRPQKRLLCRSRRVSVGGVSTPWRRWSMLIV